MSASLKITKQKVAWSLLEITVTYTPSLIYFNITTLGTKSSVHTIYARRSPSQIRSFVDLDL